MVNCFTEERQAIETHFSNSFDSWEVPVQYDNMTFLKSGDEVVADSSSLEKWVRLSILGQTSNQLEVGNNQTRFFGQVIVNVFVRENKGSQSAREIADEVFDIFDGQIVDGIQFRATELTQVPPNDGWFQMNLLTEYYWDRCKKK